ncbi:MAG TPA: dihydrofolate reductase family protein [Actinomycetota bacterium]|nr:dihydrofolate reductase family protein [Actinomycetota bacterium]
MRRLVLTEFLTLDGVMQAPGDANEDTEGGFRHGGWQMPFVDDVFMAEATKGMAQTDAHLFGRKTYEIMAAYWPTAPADDPFARHLNSVQKYVATRKLEHAEWQNTTVVRDVVEAVSELKEQPGKDISVLGSGDLAQTLMANDLVDVYSLSIFPIVLGSGKKLFRDEDQVRKLRLLESTATGTGGLILTYEPER